MTGLRIVIDIEPLVRDAWKQLPWRRRVFIRLMGGKEKVIAMAMAGLTGGHDHEDGLPAGEGR